MSSRKIIRAISLVSLGTLIARFFGLAREVSTAGFFGTTYVYDAFLIAFMIPNFFRGLLAEGALNTAFIPVFSEYASAGGDKKKQGIEIFNICFTFSLVVTLSLFIIVLASTYLFAAAVGDTSRWWWVAQLLRFTFPYLVFISLAALNMGILNAHKIFFLPSLSPVILDVVWISTLFFIIPFFGGTLEEKVFGLCIAVIVGGLGQFLFTLVPVARRGYSVRLNFNFRNPVIKRMGRLLAPVVLGVAVVPINLLVDYSLANLLYEGAVSGLWYGTRIFQLPLGIFAISLSTVVLPWLTDDFISNNCEGFMNNLYSGLHLLSLLLLPFTFGLMIFSDGIVSMLFARGMFTGESVLVVSRPLVFYAAGLLGYGGVSLMSRAFYACKDTVTPVKVGASSIMVNLVLNIVFMRFMGHSGIALSTALVGTVNFVLLLLLFSRRHMRVDFSGSIVPFFLRAFIASAVMGLVIYFYRVLASACTGLPMLLGCGMALGAASYFLLLKLVFFRGVKIPFLH